MYSHYIRTDSANRITYGFSTFHEQPGEGDILLRDNGGEEFELYGKDFNRPLSFVPTCGGREIYLYKYENGKVKNRTVEELKEDIPEIPPGKTLSERVTENENSIESIDTVINALLGIEEVI